MPSSGAAIALAAVLVALCSSAQAQDTEDDRDVRARELFEHGRGAYDAGSYEEAAQSFERAFELSGRPTLLLNAGNAWDRLREDARAAAALRQYLVLVPDADDRETIESRIALLSRSAQPTEPVGDEGLFMGRTATWVVAGSGVLLGALSAWFWAEANGDYDLLSATCGVDGSCTSEMVSGVERGLTLHHVTLGLSGLSLATAVVLFLAEGEPEVAPRPLTIAPTANGVRMDGVF